MSDLTGRVALVTGGGRDVGAEICRGLAAAGAKVAVNYNASKAEAEAVAAEITKAGGTAAAYQADVADLEQVRRMIGQVKSDFGGLGILVNNAGLVIRKRFAETQPEEWHKQIDACLYGAIHCCHAAGPCLRPQATAGSFRSSAIHRGSVNPASPSWRLRGPERSD